MEKSNLPQPAGNPELPRVPILKPGVGQDVAAVHAFPTAMDSIIVIIMIIITDVYKAPFLSRAHSALQIYTISAIRNTQTTIASYHA